MLAPWTGNLTCQRPSGPSPGGEYGANPSQSMGFQKGHTGPPPKATQLGPVSLVALPGLMLRLSQEGGCWAGQGWGHQLLSPTL